MNRRQMLKSLAALGLLPLAAGYEKAGAAVAPLMKRKEEPLKGREAEEMLRARRKARRRTRRIILNNDGQDARWEAGQPVSPELFLSKRTMGLLDSQVDSVFYCTGVTNFHTHRSEVSEMQTNFGKPHVIEAFDAMDTDTLEVMVSFCKLHNKEIFWSMRMNDTHDSGVNYEYISEFKKTHPELLIGQKGVKTPKMSSRWSAFDYGKQQVRDLMVDNLADVVTRYDVDGVELDFMRHPHYFRALYEGRRATEEDCDKMTGMVRRMRAICDREGVRRGRPVLLAIRVPDSFGFSKAIGLDWERWLGKELVDLVVATDDVKLESWADLAEKGRRYDIPVYACIEQRRFTAGEEPEPGFPMTETWRGEAYLAWKAGVNGIYTFNLFNPYDRLLREIGDPRILERLSKTDRETKTKVRTRKDEKYMFWYADYWVKGGNEFIK